MSERGIDVPSAAFDEGHFRRVVGSFCSGVVIVTSTDAGSPVGITCQAFFSLSLRPPLIAISVSNTSTTYPRIRRAGKFAVNILSSCQQHLSQQFAMSGTDKWQDVRYGAGATGLPVLHGSAAVLECDMTAEYATGDHCLVVGHVRAVDHDAGQDPLVYFRSRYRSLA
jgi:flavin reductase (DIM6/NTAB) family NADH-FMN oxidoreductase RutF